jgi:hypothetical protein
MSYVYVRKDIYKFISDADSAGLLKQFLVSLYTDSYVSQCVSYGFALPPTTVKTSALSAINNITWTDPTNSNVILTDWVFESSTMPFSGQGPYVISSKRYTGSQYQLSTQTASINQLSANVVDLKQDVAMVAATLTAPNTRVYTIYDYHRVQAALVLSALSFVMWMIFLIVVISRRVCCK